MDFLIAAVAIFTIVVYLWMKITPKNFPPGPPRFPILGSLLFLPRKYPHLIMSGKWAETYGPVVGLMFGSRKALAVSGPKTVLEVLHRDEFQGRTVNSRMQERLFSKRHGLIFTDGPYWLELRRFTLRHLRNFGYGKTSMENLIMQEVDDLIKEMRRKDTLQVHGLFKISALNVLWCMMSGTRYARDDEELQSLLQGLDKLFRSGTQSGRFLDVFPVLKRFLPESAGNKEFVDNVRNLHNFLKRTIKEHEENLDENNPRDFIDTYLIELRKQNTNTESIYTEEGLIVTCQDLFTAGGDTTDNTLGFCLLYMVLYPHVQNAVQRELDSVVGRDRRPSIEDKHRLHYVNAVLTEVMRINPSVPMTVPHRVVKDTTLNGYTIPKDTFVLINLWSLFQDREHWGDPEVFRPERFLDENKTFVKDEWMISFGAGKRVCLGETLARNTVFLFFTTLLQEFSFSVPEDEPTPQTLPLSGMIMAPQPFRVKISRRV